MKNVLRKNIADKVLLTGLVANYFLMLSGIRIGKTNEKIVEDNKEDVNDKEMKKLLEDYREKIELPIDFGIDRDGVRVDVPVDKIDEDRILDIGIETVNRFSNLIPEFDIVVINGPAGVFEDGRFALGTYEVLKAVTKAEFSVVGGGHIASATRLFGFAKKVSHISTAGGACIRYLSGEKLPALETIKEYWEKKWKQ